MGITCDEVEHRLSQHGYTVVHRTEGHSLYEHHGDQIVVPTTPGSCRPGRRESSSGASNRASDGAG